MLSSLYVTSIPCIPSWPALLYSCWLSSSSVLDCGWNSWIDAVFVTLAINATWKYTIFENNFSTFFKSIILFVFVYEPCITCIGNRILENFNCMILNISMNIHSSQCWLHVIHLKIIKKNHTHKHSFKTKKNIQLNQEQKRITISIKTNRQLLNKFRQNLEYHISYCFQVTADVIFTFL